MEYRRLGSSGMYVSEITYGNWLTHGSQVESDAAIKCVRAALDLGITTLDTADMYAGTKAETVLGKALKGVRRESYELLTKAYWPTGTGKNDRGLSRKHIMESCNASLKRLKTDYVEGYYRFVSSQPQYSMLWRVIESEVVPLCEKEGIGQIVWSPIAQGVLSGKYLPGQKAPAGSRATDKKGGAEMISKFMTNQVLTAVQKLTPIAKKVDLTPAQLAIAWVLSNSNVSSAIIGATKPAQIKENVKAAGVKLDKQILSEIDAVLAGVVEKDPAKTVSPNPRA